MSQPCVCVCEGVCNAYIGLKQRFWGKRVPSGQLHTPRVSTCIDPKWMVRPLDVWRLR
jgi:hypothetical protein